MHRHTARGHVNRDMVPGISLQACSGLDRHVTVQAHVRTTTTTTTSVAILAQGAILSEVATFPGVSLAFLALAGGLVVDGCTRRCRRRHRECPPPERAKPPLALASRADGGRNGPCRVAAPYLTAPEDGKGRGRGTSCTTRPRSGSASPPRAGSAACCGTSLRACTRCSCAADGGPTGGRAHALRLRGPRAGDRSAQDLVSILSSSRGSCRHADGGAVGGSATACGACRALAAFKILPNQGSAASSAVLPKEPFQGFFSHFSSGKKCEGHPASECEGARALQLIQAERLSKSGGASRGLLHRRWKLFGADTDVFQDERG